MNWSFLLLIMVGVAPLLSASSAWAFSIVPCTQGETGVCRQVNNLTLSEVQSAVNAATPSDGTYYRDGVYLIAGSATWPSMVNLTGKHGLVVMGAGTANTHITCGTCFWNSATNRTRLSGIHFIGTGGTAQVIRFVGISSNVRVDHISTTGSFLYAVVLTDLGRYTGVFDHNTIAHSNGSGGYFQGDVDNAFRSPIDFGSANWFFVEDNTFVTDFDGDYFETHLGGKAVFRHNTVIEGAQTLQSFFDQHNAIDPMTPGSAGGRGVEIYNNTIVYTRPPGAFVRHHFFRSGTGLVYNNIIDYTGRGVKPGATINLIDFRAEGGDPWTSGGCASSASTQNVSLPSMSPTSLARCGSTAYHPNGVGNFPQGEGYPVIGAPGVGVWGGTHEPWYFWNNRYTNDNGATYTYWNNTTDVDVKADVVWSVAENRDWCYSQIAQPTSCGGVPLTYTPYTYPHPLVAGTPSPSPPSPPQNLRVQ